LIHQESRTFDRRRLAHASSRPGELEMELGAPDRARIGNVTIAELIQGKVALHSACMKEADCEPLLAAGFSREDIWDIGAIAAFFAMANCLAGVTAMRANEEFYLLGRLPRQQ